MSFFQRWLNRRMQAAYRDAIETRHDNDAQNTRMALSVLHYRLQAGQVDMAARVAMLNTIEDLMPELAMLHVGINPGPYDIKLALRLLNEVIKQGNNDDE